MPAYRCDRPWTLPPRRLARAGLRVRFGVVGGIVLGLLIGCAMSPAAYGADDPDKTASGPWQQLTGANSRVAGTLSCASATCHGRSNSDPVRVSRAGDEFLTWLEHDPHARAARTLDSAEFQRILTTVSGTSADSPASRAVYRQCAACHDPEGLAATEELVESPAVIAHPTASANGRGIGCESCHGHAERWLTKHYERGYASQLGGHDVLHTDVPTREVELEKLGLRDLNNLVLRGRVCAGCHVGDDDHDMHHDMIAAGHPPLRFELSAYHDLIRRKHWNEPQRSRNHGFKLELWAAGQVAVADAALGLTASRAARATDTRTAGSRASRPRDGGSKTVPHAAPWPEFAEYDCFACHQRLRPVVAAPARDATSLESSLTAPLAARATGVTPWQTWNLPTSGPGARWLAEPRGAESNREQAGPSFFTLDKLRDEMSDLRRADPARVASLATDARAALRGKFGWPAGTVAGGGVASGAVAPDESIVWQLVGLPNSSCRSWAEACHQWLLLRTAYLAIVDSPVLAGSLDAARRTRLERQLREIARSLSFGSTQIEWPAYDWSGLAPGRETPAPLRDLPSIAAALDNLAAELQAVRRDRPQRENAVTN